VTHSIPVVTISETEVVSRSTSVLSTMLSVVSRSLIPQAAINFREFFKRTEAEHSTTHLINDPRGAAECTIPQQLGGIRCNPLNL
jgi:hypothetical protein